MISLENNPYLKRDKALEDKLISLLLELEKDAKAESECSSKGHPNAKFQDIISSASGALYYCPNCDKLIHKQLTEEQQKIWHDVVNTVYKSRA
ncbi:hypothetical protein J4226_03230 [Candidatus Pacearchaeota archaeon]|nr:hypothetical protein [Candidatus Pacearchaeota archaeon]